MLLEKLEQEGIKKELEALGYNCEEIFGGLNEETDRLYASYSWQKIPCTVEGIREYVIHAVPPKELREKDYPWEEWFIQFDEPVHHVLFMHDQEICNAEVPIPEPLICARSSSSSISCPAFSIASTMDPDV